MKPALIIVLSLWLSACMATKTESPFADQKGYEPLDWPNLDFPLFILSTATFFHKTGKWPASISEIEEGTVLWIESAAEKEKQVLMTNPRPSLANVFTISEIIPMRGGVAYRLVYKKKGYEIKGLIVLDSGEDTESIVKSAKLSEDFGGIMHAVPF